MHHGRRTTGRLLTIGGLTLALAGLGGAVAAQDDGPGLCDAFKIETFEAAVGLEYAKPGHVGRDGGCRYRETEVDEQGYSGSIGAVIEDDPGITQTYDYRRDIADDGDEVDAIVDGQRAFARQPGGLFDFDRWDILELIVDLGGGTLEIRFEAESGAVPDQLDQMIRLAEEIVGNVGLIAGPPTGGSGIELPAVEGITWQEQFGGTADQLSNASAFSADQMLPLAEAVGTDLSSVVLLISDARDEAGEAIGQVGVILFDGAEQAILKEAVGEWLADSLDGTGLEPETVTVDGKDSLMLAFGSNTFYYYVNGDTFYLIALPVELGDQLLAALR